MRVVDGREYERHESESLSYCKSFNELGKVRLLSLTRYILRKTCGTPSIAKRAVKVNIHQTQRAGWGDPRTRLKVHMEVALRDVRRREKASIKL